MTLFVIPIAVGTYKYKLHFMKSQFYLTIIIMKHTSLLLFMSLVLSFSIGCSKEDPVDEVTYTLTVANRSGIDLDVYIKSDRDPNYISKGTVLDTQDKVIPGLVIAVEYTVGAVEAGGDPSTITNEVTFTNSDPETTDYTLTFN